MAELSNQISKSKMFEEYSRDDLDLILKEQKLSQSDLMNQKTSVKIGELKGLEGIITGEYIIAEHYLIITIKLNSIKTGKIVATANCKVAKTDLPEGINFLPRNNNIIKENTVDLPKTGSLEVKVWTSKGEGAVYKKGEKLFVFFKANKDCYVRLIHIDAIGVKKMIFPNDYHPDTKKLTANQVYVFPDTNMNFDFELSEPFGTEEIIAIASTDPFKDKIEAFTEIKGSTAEIGKKGIDIKKKKNEIADGKVYYTIVDKK